MTVSISIHFYCLLFTVYYVLPACFSFLPPNRPLVSSDCKKKKLWISIGSLLTWVIKYRYRFNKGLKMHRKRQEKKKLPDWAKRFVLVTWLRLEPSADFSTFLITTSPAPTPAWPFWARSSLCCRSSCRRVSRSFSLWSGVEWRGEEKREGMEKWWRRLRDDVSGKKGGQEVLNKLPAPHLTATKMD